MTQRTRIAPAEATKPGESPKQLGGAPLAMLPSAGLPGSFLGSHGPPITPRGPQTCYFAFRPALAAFFYLFFFFCFFFFFFFLLLLFFFFFLFVFVFFFFFFFLLLFLCFFLCFFFF